MESALRGESGNRYNELKCHLTHCFVRRSLFFFPSLSLSPLPLENSRRKRTAAATGKNIQQKKPGEEWNRHYARFFPSIILLIIHPLFFFPFKRSPIFFLPVFFPAFFSLDHSSIVRPIFFPSSNPRFSVFLSLSFPLSLSSDKQLQKTNSNSDR